MEKLTRIPQVVYGLAASVRLARAAPTPSSVTNVLAWARPFRPFCD